MNPFQEPGLSMRQMVSVLATLDAVQESDRTFHISLDNGQEARCVLVEGDLPALGALLGQKILIGGMAVYHPSERLERIEVDHFSPGEGVSPLFARIPWPWFTSPLPVSEPSPRPFGLAGFVSHWEDDMTDEEWNQMLEELS